MLKKIIKQLLSFDFKKNVENHLSLIDANISKLCSEFSNYKNLMITLDFLEKFPGKTINEAKKSLFTNYPTPEGFLLSIQQCNLKLLKDLKKECDSLKIKFWLHAGTLIGALRHSGFIPWDDDVDIGMEREDFNILREHLKKNTNFILNEFYNQITCSRQYQLKYNNEVPCFIDIVIWDKSNAKTPAQIIEHRNNFNMIKKQMLKNFHDLKLPPVIDVGYYMLGMYDGMNKIEIDKILNTAVNSFSFDDTDNDYSLFYSIMNYPFPYPLMLNNQFYPLKLVPFEDTAFYVPADSEKYLEGYGDIYLPPNDIGKNSHIYAFLSKKNIIENFISEVKNEQ